MVNAQVGNTATRYGVKPLLFLGCQNNPGTIISYTAHTHTHTYNIPKSLFVFVGDRHRSTTIFGRKTASDRINARYGDWSYRKLSINHTEFYYNKLPPPPDDYDDAITYSRWNLSVCFHTPECERYVLLGSAVVGFLFFPRRVCILVSSAHSH